MESPAQELQFEKAELSSPAAGAACTGCSAPIADSYFEANGTVLCPACKLKLEQAFTGGSKAARALKALLLGTGAAAVGAGLWYLVRALTGYEIGLISIAIGIGVGLAVRKGSEGRGGWFYQAMAVFLTYSAVAFTYIPEVARELNRRSEAEIAAEGTAAGEATTAEASLAAGSREPTPSGARAVIRGVVFAVVAVVIGYAAPILSGIDSPMGLLIIAFGLYEAWRHNKRQVIKFVGPLKLAPAQAPAPASPADA